MEEFLKESAHPETMDFYLKLLGRKEKFLGLIREGKVTADAYRQLLEKKKAQNISKYTKNNSVKKLPRQSRTNCYYYLNSPRCRSGLIKSWPSVWSLYQNSKPCLAGLNHELRLNPKRKGFKVSDKISQKPGYRNQSNKYPSTNLSRLQSRNQSNRLLSLSRSHVRVELLKSKPRNRFSLLLNRSQTSQVSPSNSLQVHRRWLNSNNWLLSSTSKLLLKKRKLS